MPADASHLPPDEAPPGVPEWVVTYGDMMSLLLTFFIMLVSMSELKEEGQVRMMLDSIREAFGATESLLGAPGKSTATSSMFSQLASQSRVSEGGTAQAGRKSDGLAGAHHTVERINHGTVVSLGGPALFGRFDAALSDQLRADLDVIAAVVRDRPNQLMVRGHASPEPLPLDPPFLEVLGRPARDAMDLSYARAHAVAEYLIARGIERERLLVSASGDSEPHKLTRRKDLQQLNHRVDVFLIDTYITPPQPAGRQVE